MPQILHILLTSMIFFQNCAKYKTTIEKNITFTYVTLKTRNFPWMYNWVTELIKLSKKKLWFKKNKSCDIAYLIKNSFCQNVKESCPLDYSFRVKAHFTIWPMNLFPYRYYTEDEPLPAGRGVVALRADITSCLTRECITIACSVQYDQQTVKLVELTLLST